MSVSLSRSPQAAARRCGAGDAAPPRRWVPFAEGPRSCVGQALAQVTLPATLALLLGRFRFRLAPQARPRGACARVRCMVPWLPWRPCMLLRRLSCCYPLHFS